ncbi:MAG: nucleotidyltransferase [Candidatus Moraniibacteriota bacterium]|nr:MAG: nucleotidyltransferase [Candidatus Moranbacteria bacterium]
MGIPFSQLETWANQGATVSAKATHESIRCGLTHEKSPVKSLIESGKAKVYLQGSYKNSTNIRADSDVDVVVELTMTFGHNAHELPPEQKSAHDLAYSNATYDWHEFRRDVIKALTLYYGASSIDTTGNKSIKLLPAPGRLKADIVPVISFRRYNYFHGVGLHSAEEGIKLYHQQTNKPIVNYPEHHYQNGVDKNSNLRTGGVFKPTVRIFKNMRNHLIEKKALAKEMAPSYFLQSLIYNVPDPCFQANHSATVYAVLKHLYENPVEGFVCQNEQHLLFGDTPEQWNVSNAHTTIMAFVKLWDNWGK